MKKKLLMITMAMLAITSSPLLGSCGDDVDEPEKVPEQGTKGIHKIEATFSGDTENWVATRLPTMSACIHCWLRQTSLMSLL